MAGKKSFVLRLDETTFRLLERWAADEFRSVNGQLEWMVDRALRDSGRLKADPEKKSSSKKEEPEV